MSLRKNIHKFTWYSLPWLIAEWKSEWLLFNANSAIFLLYHGENKLIFIEIQTYCNRIDIHVYLYTYAWYIYITCDHSIYLVYETIYIGQYLCLLSKQCNILNWHLNVIEYEMINRNIKHIYVYSTHWYFD